MSDPKQGGEMLKLDRESYNRLLDEDLQWLELQPRTLEREHIMEVLRWEKKESVHYPSSASRLLAEALKAVEWVPEYEGQIMVCPWCDQYKEYGHWANCPRQLALDAVRLLK